MIEKKFSKRKIGDKLVIVVVHNIACNAIYLFLKYVPPGKD
jgi:hypothetical protein